MSKSSSIRIGKDVHGLVNRLYAELCNKEGELNYAKPLLRLMKNKRFFARNRDFYAQVLAEYASYVRYSDQSSVFRFPQSTEEPPAPFILQEATPIILQQAKDRQVVMINEAHTKPQHRLFTETLLAPFYQAGFRTLAMEALSWGDPSINQRKYPLGFSGTYTKEPYFGSLIRRALALGFSVVPYEIKKMVRSNREREKQQAENLAEYLQENPGTKLLVFAGHSHINKEFKTAGTQAMAALFRQKTGIEPLTIEQTILKYRQDCTRVSVFYKDGMPWMPERFRKGYDLMLVYPHKPMHNLHKELQKRSITFTWRAHKNMRNNLVQIFYCEEYELEANKAIPIDQKIILTDEHQIELTFYLAANQRYFICVKDSKNDILFSQKIMLSPFGGEEMVLY